MKLRLLPSAWRDLAAAYYFYENQRAGLGSEFRETVLEEIEKLSSTAGVHRRVFGQRRLLVRRFPYAVYYLIENGDVLVLAVLDCRRDPIWIRKRLN